MKDQVRSDPFSRDALAFLFRAFNSPELARCQTVGDFEDLQAEIDARAPLVFLDWLESPAAQSKLRRRAYDEYRARHKVTQKQICQSLQVDPSDFRKYLKGLKFRPDSAVVQRINEFLLGAG
jgi:hypothetical protein